MKYDLDGVKPSTCYSVPDRSNYKTDFFSTATAIVANISVMFPQEMTKTAFYICERVGELTCFDFSTFCCAFVLPRFSEYVHIVPSITPDDVAEIFLTPKSTAGI